MSWPALMLAETAAQYLDMGETSFRLFAEARDLRPAPTGIRGFRWRRADIDREVEKLGPECYDASYQPANDDPAAALARIKRRTARR